MDRSVGRVMAVIHRVGRTWAEASSIAGRTARLDRARTGGFGGRRSERHPGSRRARCGAPGPGEPTTADNFPCAMGW